MRRSSPLALLGATALAACDASVSDGTAAGAAILRVWAHSGQEAVDSLGPERLVHLERGDVTLVARIPRSQAPPVVDERVGVAADAAQAHLFGPGGRRLTPWAPVSA